MPSKKSRECAIAAVAAPDLLELLLHHSDIGVPSLTALACTSKDFCRAVDQVWPSLMTEYDQKCREGPGETRTPKEIPNVYVEKGILMKDACKIFAERIPGGEGFALDCEDEAWSRQDALMPAKTVRKTYLLPRLDLIMLQPFIISGEEKPPGRRLKHYKYEDVLGAGMLRYGRMPYVERLLKKPIRDYKQAELNSDRRELVRHLRPMPPEITLSPSFLDHYAGSYIRTGIGLREVKKRIGRHVYYACMVRVMTGSLWNGPEQASVAHLQKAYVWTEDYELVETAIKIIMSRRMAGL